MDTTFDPNDPELLGNRLLEGLGTVFGSGPVPGRDPRTGRVYATAGQATAAPVLPELASAHQSVPLPFPDPLPDFSDVQGGASTTAPKPVLPALVPAHDPANPLAVPDVQPDSHIRYQDPRTGEWQDFSGPDRDKMAADAFGQEHQGGVVTANLEAMGPEQRLEHDTALAKDAGLRVRTEQARQMLAELRNPFSDASRRSMTVQYQAEQTRRRLQTLSQAMALHEAITADPSRSPQERQDSATKLRMYQSLYNREKEQAQLTLPASAGRSLGYFDPRYPAMPAGGAPGTPEEKQ